jgi:hypothetical protein
MRSAEGEAFAWSTCRRNHGPTLAVSGRALRAADRERWAGTMSMPWSTGPI